MAESAEYALKQISLDEAHLENEFYRLYGALNAIRNKVHIVKKRIDMNQRFESQLAKKLNDGFQTEIEQISVDVCNLFEQMRQFADGNPAADEWLDFIQACGQKIGDVNDIETLELTINISEAFELQRLLGRYRNSRYLHTPQ